MEYILAHDIGTSVCKAALFTRDGHLVKSTNETFPTYFPQSLWAEQDPAELWEAVKRNTRQLMEQSSAKPGEILGIAFSTPIVNAILLDKEGKPLRPCITWLDGRAVEEARGVMRRLGGPAIFAAIVGASLTGKDLLPKYLWLKRHEPDIYRQAAAIVDVSGFLLYKTTGRLVYEWSAASATGLFNLKAKTWDGSIMRLFGVEPGKFPELVQSAERVGGMTQQAADELGLSTGTPVFGGAGDPMTAAVGSGAVLEGDGYLSLGTSGFVGILTSKKVTGKGGLVTIHSADPGKLMLIGESETSGECLTWAAREIYGMEPTAETFARLDEVAAKTEPGSGGLIFTPWMYGERCPVADERARAGFINLCATHTKAHMLRSIYEGVAYNIRWILESISEYYGFRPEPLRVVGGGAKGLPWLQIISDCTGYRVESIQNPQQAISLGAALIAAVGLGIYPSLEATKPVVTVARQVNPNPGVKPVYDEMYKGFRQVYPSLKKLYHTLNKPQGE